MMHITPQRLAAIKALADDPRGDPNTRAIARRKLEEYQTEFPSLFGHPHFRGDPRNPPNPRTQTSPEYEKFKFMNMDSWKQSAKGNWSTGITHKRHTYGVTLFKYKSGLWGWVRSFRESATWCNRRFDNVGEAQRDAWENLMRI